MTSSARRDQGPPEGSRSGRPDESFRYPGNRLGLPADGPGSVAGWGRRIVALFIDWILAGLVASAVTGRPLWAGGNDLGTTQLLLFFAMSAILAGLAGGTIGHRLLGLRVVRVHNNAVVPGPIGLLASTIRSFLICLVIPPVVYDRDRRGLHDRAARTIVVHR